MVFKFYKGTEPNNDHYFDKILGEIDSPNIEEATTVVFTSNSSHLFDGQKILITWESSYNNSECSGGRIVKYNKPLDHLLWEAYRG